MAMADGLDFDTVEKLLLRSPDSRHRKSPSESQDYYKSGRDNRAAAAAATMVGYHQEEEDGPGFSSRRESQSDDENNNTTKKSRDESERLRSPRRRHRRELSRSVEHSKKASRRTSDYRDFSSIRKHSSRRNVDYDESDELEDRSHRSTNRHRSYHRDSESRRYRSDGRGDYSRRRDELSRSRSASRHHRRRRRSESRSSTVSRSAGGTRSRKIGGSSPPRKHSRGGSIDDRNKERSSASRAGESKIMVDDVVERAKNVPADKFPSSEDNNSSISIHNGGVGILQPIPSLGKVVDEDMRRKREIEEARRDDMTVLVLNLNLKSTELDVYEFFSEHAGKVRDIQLIKDQRSGRAKGVAYVEFYTQAAVIKALALSGQPMKGQPVRVQASQAEKNRAAKAARVQQAEVTDGPMKVYVGGLIEALSHITDSELKQLFTPFGEIMSVDIQRDPYTGRSKGYAFIQFRRASEAREAMAAMNGYVLGGRPLKVGFASEPSKPSVPAGIDPIAVLQQQSSVSSEAFLAQQLAAQQLQQQNDQQDSDRLDDDGGGLLSGPGSKLALMQKLQRDKPIQMNNTSSAGGPFVDPMLAMAEQEAKLLADRALANGLFQSSSSSINMQNMINLQRPVTEVSPNVILNNMFTASEVNLEEDPTFFVDIMDEVRSECSKYGGVLKVWINEAALDGKIWIKFENTDQALSAFKGLNGRYFGGNTITVEFISDAVWLASSSWKYHNA